MEPAVNSGGRQIAGNPRFKPIFSSVTGGKTGFGVRGSGFGVRGSGFGVRGSGFGARGEGRGASDSADDLTRRHFAHHWSTQEQTK